MVEQESPAQDPAAAALEALWGEFHRAHSPGARERLILHYAPLVKLMAAGMASRLPSSVETADLVSYGLFGLMDALDRFEPERGFRFETFARQRIRGAILDELRALDWVPRSIRAKARRIEQATEHLERRLGRSPSDEEVAGELGESLEELRDDIVQVSFASVTALDAESRSGDGVTEVSLLDALASGSVAPRARFEEQETHLLLRDAVRNLAERDRAVVVLTYFEGMTLAEVGEVLGVSESRVCQIHGRAIRELRDALSEETRREDVGSVGSRRHRKRPPAHVA